MKCQLKPRRARRSAQPLDGMKARTAVLVLMLLIACSDEHGPQQFDEWDVLNEVGTPGRWVELTWAVDDRSCLAPNGIQVLGELDSAEYDKIIQEIRNAHPRDAILLVRRSGRYADVLTGANCVSRGTGGGDLYLLRLEGMNWRVKRTTKWH